MSDTYLPPPLYFTPKKALAPHLRSWTELRRQIKSGAFGTLWRKIARQAKLDLGKPPLTPSSIFPGREPDQAIHANRDFTISVGACQRVLRSALLFKVTGDRAFKECCLEQIMTLCDPKIWVEWRDKSHVHLGIPADLRTGWISRDVAIAYNWLHSSLSKKQRQQIIEGIDRMGIQPFLKSLPMNPQWMQRPTNWMTCVVGGMGICGMALGRDHPDAAQLIRISKPKMEAYFKIFGPAGEFNESPGYAGSIMLVVKYYSALACIEPHKPNRLAAFPFPQAANWIQHLVLGPKRLAGFGDSHPEASPFVAHYAAVAAATNDPVIQGLSQHYRTSSQGYVAPDVFELVWFDPSLPAKKPGVDYPRHATFKAHAACFSSRTDWKTSGPDCIVYGKAGREPHHAHPDAGQVCIDAYGTRLITDLGLPAGGYPADYFGRSRYEYYNASVSGHNLLTINNREQPDRPAKGRYISEGLLPDGLGVHWVYDLKACHPVATRITRAVFHFYPNIMAVIDDAHTAKPASFRLRWHTARPTEIKADGSFQFTAGRATLNACVKSLSRAKPIHQSGRHAYEAPYDRNRLGEKLAQRREPYVDTITKGKHGRFLTVFATAPATTRTQSWREKNGRLIYQDSQHGRFGVWIAQNTLHYETPLGVGSLDLATLDR